MRRFMIWNPPSAVPDKRALIDMAADYLAAQGAVTDRRAAAEAIRERERLGDTMIAANLAIPHAMSEAVREATMLFVALEHGLDDWQPGRRVDRYLFTLIPPDAPADDLAGIRDLYLRLADDRTLDALAGGGRPTVQAILDPTQAFGLDPERN